MDAFITSENEEEETQSQKEQKEKIAAGLISDNSENQYVPSPNTILEVNRLTRRMENIHIQTPNTDSNSQNSDFSFNAQVMILSQNSQDEDILLKNLNCSQEFPSGQKIYIKKPWGTDTSKERYDRMKKLENVKINFLNFINLFSDKDWREGVQVEVLRINFQNYFHLPISKQGLGQLKEVKEFLYTKRKRINNKLTLIYKRKELKT